VATHLLKLFKLYIPSGGSTCKSKLFIHSVMSFMWTFLLCELFMLGELKNGAKDDICPNVFPLFYADFGLTELSIELPSGPTNLNNILKVLNSVALRDTSLLCISLLTSLKNNLRFVLINATIIWYSDYIWLDLIAFDLGLDVTALYPPDDSLAPHGSFSKFYLASLVIFDYYEYNWSAINNPKHLTST